METVTIEQVREALGAETVFMRQGKSGKVVHLSAGACRENNLLCGATYSHGGNRRSYIFPLYIREAKSSEMCKDCLARFTKATTS